MKPLIDPKSLPFLQAMMVEVIKEKRKEKKERKKETLTFWLNTSSKTLELIEETITKNESL